jgi:predicted RNA-binding protein with TRAM domain
VPHIYVSLDRDEDGYPPYEVEEIDASESGNGLYRIEGIPVFVYGISRGDLVKVVQVKGDSRLWIAEVVKVSDHWTVRVLPRRGLALTEVAVEFSEVGCDAYPTPFGLVAIDVPSHVKAEDIMDRLNRGRTIQRWDFDLGVSPP